MGSAFEIEWEHSTQEKVIVRVDCHIFLALELDIMNFWGSSKR